MKKLGCIVFCEGVCLATCIVATLLTVGTEHLIAAMSTLFFAVTIVLTFGACICIEPSDED